MSFCQGMQYNDQFYPETNSLTATGTQLLYS